MNFDRRTFLKTVGAVTGVSFASGRVAAESDWGYDLRSRAPVPGAADCYLQDEWAYVANFSGMTTYDLSNPSLPVFGATVPGHGDTADNRDVKVDGDIAGLADNDDPGGVTFYDVSDPADPVELSFYDADSGVHNHYIDGDHAYLTIMESGEASFSESRMSVVNIADPTTPEKLGEWKLKDYREDMATAGTNPIHDILVRDNYCYMSWWNAGVIVADVTDPANPREIAHFGATPDATRNYDSELAETQAYVGRPENAHYTEPTPSREYTLIGAESFAEPTGTALSSTHGGIRIFHTPELTRPAQGHPTLDPEKHDPHERDSLATIRSPDNPEDAVRTAHNFDLTENELFASWYQGGVRAYDISDKRDPQEEAAYAPPEGAFWTAENLEIPTEDGQFYTVGSDTGEGLHVLELQR